MQQQVLIKIISFYGHNLLPSIRQVVDSARIKFFIFGAKIFVDSFSQFFRIFQVFLTKESLQSQKKMVIRRSDGLGYEPGATSLPSRDHFHILNKFLLLILQHFFLGGTERA